MYLRDNLFDTEKLTSKVYRRPPHTLKGLRAVSMRNTKDQPLAYCQQNQTKYQLHFKISP